MQRQARPTKITMVILAPSVLKDGTAFRTWREEFERYSGLKIRGMHEVLKLIGERSSGGQACRKTLIGS